MTKQEIFDKVVQGLAGQDFKRSLSAARSCQYRGENGTKCAVGHLIPDEVYDPIWEGTGFCAMYEADRSLGGPRDRTRFQILDAAGIGIEHSQLLTDLQSAHDYGSSPEGMKRGLRDAGLKHELQIPDALLPSPSE